MLGSKLIINKVGEVIQRFERKGYTLVAMKLVQVTLEHAQKHYEDLKEKPFYKGLCEYIASGPIVAMVRPEFYILI